VKARTSRTEIHEHSSSLLSPYRSALSMAAFENDSRTAPPISVPPRCRPADGGARFCSRRLVVPVTPSAARCRATAMEAGRHARSGALAGWTYFMFRLQCNNHPVWPGTEDSWCAMENRRALLRGWCPAASGVYLARTAPRISFINLLLATVVRGAMLAIRPIPI
jgi:hypothetical protein